jgi:hypothetical protein
MLKDIFELFKKAFGEIKTGERKLLILFFVSGLFVTVTAMKILYNSNERRNERERAACAERERQQELRIKRKDKLIDKKDAKVDSLITVSILKDASMIRRYDSIINIQNAQKKKFRK